MQLRRFPSRALASVPTALAACVAILPVQPGAAQAPGPDSLHQQMSNQLGILDHCIAKGFPSQAAAATYAAFLASLPAPADPEAVALFREKGREGIIYNGEDSQISAEQMAEGTSQTLEEYCKSFDENAKALETAQ